MAAEVTPTVEGSAGVGNQEVEEIQVSEADFREADIKTEVSVEDSVATVSTTTAGSVEVLDEDVVGLGQAQRLIMDKQDLTIKGYMNCPLRLQLRRPQL